MNTRISYLYRDASNYKAFNTAVLRGLLSKEQIREIISCLEEEERFIPEQVGLPADRLDRYERCEDDTCWLELYESGFEPTNQKATVEITAEELLERFRKAKDNWKTFEVY